ncbi:MAG: protein kinase [Anaerolineae bacterium]|nr:protein kinase [Anaerolineae bacterium]
MSEEKKRVAGRYELGELIGRGGMGDVFKGTDTVSGETVAIKLLHDSIIQDNPDIVDRFRREGEMLRKLDHPNIVNLLDALEEGDQHYLVMEYVGGGSLRDLMDDQSHLPVVGVLNLALDLADALTRAHRLNIIHRDIKPDNVLLKDNNSKPLLTDFGVAHMGDRTRLTATGSVIGTYAYLSPEACNGLPLDERTDIWSLGVMMYEMLAGRLPFQETGTAAILTAILSKPAPDLKRLRPSAPDALVDLIYKMLEKDRERRISSVRLVGAELEAIIRSLDTPWRRIALGDEHPSGESRFATPSDSPETSNDVPAMIRSDDSGHTHGFSLYPAVPPKPSLVPPEQRYTPGGTPLTHITGEFVANPTNFKWLALLLMVAISACACVFVIAVIASSDRSSNKDQPLGSPPPDLSIEVEPVEDDYYMVLVADLEALPGASPRDVSRFVVDDLQQRFEQDVPFSSVAVRAYPAIITTGEDARKVAENNNAAVIVWGSYSDDLIDLNIQVGATARDFPYIAFDRGTLEQLANGRVRLTDPRRESVAMVVVSAINTLIIADGGLGEFAFWQGVIDTLDVHGSEIVGSGPGAHLHRAVTLFTRDTTQAIDALDAAIARDSSVAILYFYRGSAYLRLGDLERSATDFETAIRLGPDTWMLPDILNPQIEAENVMAMLDRFIEVRPDDWYTYLVRGIGYYYYIPNGYAQAEADLLKSIEVGAPISYPHMGLVMLKLHQGDIAAVQELAATILDQFADAAISRRIMQAMEGENQADPVGAVFIGGNDLIVGQYADSRAAVTPAIEAQFNQTMIPGSLGESNAELADLFLIQGLALCNQKDYIAAHESFGQAIKFDRNFALAYMLRGQMRRYEANARGAEADFQAAQDHTPGAGFDRWLSAGIDGDWTCENFFEYTLPAE